MSLSIKLSDELIIEARKHAVVYSRSIPKQIEYWSRIGKIVEENPDLPFSLIKDVMISLEEIKHGEIEPYVFEENEV